MPSEDFNSEPIIELNELQPRLNAEFEEYKEMQLAGIRKEYEELIKIDMMHLDELEPKLEERQRELQALDIYEQIAKMVNNFYFWFPGGYYRQLLQERKKKKDVDQNKIIADERLIQDVDDIIRERGYAVVIDSIVQKEGIAREVRLKILADIYLAMREKGYDRLRLAR